MRAQFDLVGERGAVDRANEPNEEETPELVITFIIIFKCLFNLIIRDANSKLN